MPAIVERPALITQTSVTHLRAFSSDICPTLFDLIGIIGNNSYLLDGVSLMHLIN